jgi:lysozyme family protein
MDVNDAKRIYRAKYWDALNCDSLESGVDYTVFDYGVNSGLGRPRKALQRFKSLKGAELIDAINNERATFLQAIGKGKNAEFEAGWQARVKRVRNYSHFLNAQTNNTAGPVSGGGVLSIGAALSQFWHQHETAIIVTSLVAAIVIGAAVHLYKNRNK